MLIQKLKYKKVCNLVDNFLFKYGLVSFYYFTFETLCINPTFSTKLS